MRGFKKIQWQHQQWFFLPQSDKCILKWDHKTKDKLLTSSRLPTKYESVLLLHTTSAFQPVWQDCILHQHLLPLSALPLPVSLTPQSLEAHAAGTLHAEKCTVLIIIPQNNTHLGQNPCEFFFTCTFQYSKNTHVSMTDRHHSKSQLCNSSHDNPRPESHHFHGSKIVLCTSSRKRGNNRDSFNITCNPTNLTLSNMTPTHFNWIKRRGL